MQSTFLSSTDNLLPKHGHVRLLQNAIDVDFKHLRSEIAWKHEKIHLFGRHILQPRLTAWYGDPGTTYVYSGLHNEPLAWTETLLEIKQQVEQHTTCNFNSVLLNLYRDGQDSMGWHQDNEPELGEQPCIASLSLGETRTFQMRHKFDKSLNKLDFVLSNGTLLIMSGSTQRYWQHQVPKTKKKNKVIPSYYFVSNITVGV